MESTSSPKKSIRYGSRLNRKDIGNAPPYGILAGLVYKINSFEIILMQNFLKEFKGYFISAVILKVFFLRFSC